MPFLLAECWCHNPLPPQKRYVLIFAKIPPFYLHADQTCCPQGRKGKFSKPTLGTRCPQICSGSGWAFAVVLTLGSAWGARFCRDTEPLPLQAQIWSAEVHPWLDFKLLLLWKVPILSFPRFPLAPIQCCFGMSHLHVIISAALNWGGLWCQGWLSGGTGQFSLLGNCNIFPCCFIMSFIYQIGNSSVEK